jgi:signal transduction histidine kinase
MSTETYSQVVQLVRSVRHDAYNPLTAALGNVQLLLDDPGPLDPDALETLRIVESELRRLSEILRRLNAVREAPDPAPAG